MLWALLAVSLLLTALGIWHGLSLTSASFELGHRFPARSDEGEYWFMAKQLLAGEVVTQRKGQISHRSVLYGASLAPILWAYGVDAHGMRACRIFHVALAGTLPFLTSLLTLQLVGRRRLGVIAAAVVLPLVAWNELVWKSARRLVPDTSAAVLLLVGCLLLLGALESRRHYLRAFAGGVLLATAALFEYALLPAVLAACAHLGYRTIRQALRSRTPGAWSGFQLPALALVATLGALTVVAALGFRNQAHTGKLFISSKGGVNFYIGNNEHAIGRYKGVSYKNAPRGELERARYFWKKAGIYIARRPKHFATGLWKKWCRLRRELGKQYVIAGVRLDLFAHLLLYGLLANGLLALAAPLSRQQLAAGFLGVLALANVVLVVLVFVYWRYVLSVVLFGPVVGAAVVCRWGTWGWRQFLRHFLLATGFGARPPSPASESTGATPRGSAVSGCVGISSWWTSCQRGCGLQNTIRADGGDRGGGAPVRNVSTSDDSIGPHRRDSRAG